MAVPTYFDQFLNGKPSVHELYEHVRVGTNWQKLGVLLKLDITKLNDIKLLNEDSDIKSLKMFELWLSSKPNPTRREIIETLKKPGISGNAIAEQYKEILPESKCEQRLREHVKFFHVSLYNSSKRGCYFNITEILRVSLTTHSTYKDS